MSTTPQSQAILQEVLQALAPDPNGGALRFATPPAFVADRVAQLPLDEKKSVVRELAAFGHFLATKKDSPDASRALMAVLEGIAKESHS